jgi:hypothetical protein
MHALMASTRSIGVFSKFFLGSLNEERDGGIAGGGIRICSAGSGYYDGGASYPGGTVRYRGTDQDGKERRKEIQKEEGS